MMPIAFIGGTLTGIVGLAAATYIDHKIGESKFSPNLKKPQTLDAEQVCRELNNYFFKAQALELKCNKIVLEGSDLISDVMPLPWDNIFQKAVNSIGGKLLGISRRGKISQLLGCGKEAKQLYGRYEGIFARANALLEATGKMPVNLVQSVEFDIAATKPTANEDWENEFEKLADAIREVIEKTCAAAEVLIEKLD